jgi:hypothetical protein
MKASNPIIINSIHNASFNSSQSQIYSKVKGKAIPVTGHEGS